MALRIGSTSTRVALATGLATVLSVVAYAQLGGGPPPPPYTPAEGAKDLKSVLFNWPWHMGMLRGIEEHELAVTLEYRGEGTIQVNGQPCAIKPYEEAREGELGTSGYRIGIAYQFAGSRTQINCTLPNGRTYSNIEVVSGTYAWDEDKPGAGLVEGEGTAKPMRESVDERLIRLWASPQGAAKAALAGAGIDPMKVFRNPGGLLAEGASTIGKTSVTWDGNTPVVTFPIPGVDDATAVARLDDRFMTESVVVTQGRNRYEFAYSDYNDYNNPLNLIEVYMPGRMIERRNGTVVRDVKTVVTETGSVYVVVPVPASVGPTQPLPMYGSDQQPPVLNSDASTPRLAGKPDLTGGWAGGNKFFIWRYGNRRCAPTQLDGCSPQWNQTVDFEFEAASRFGPNRPLYRPEHWDKVVYLDMWTNRLDPIMTCQPMGIPRQGPPGRIFQTENDITFLYGRGGDGGGGYSDFRVIATDGRAFDERQLIQTKYTGHSVGRWEGDTLVVESRGFTPDTWLARGGFFHSDDISNQIRH